MLVRNFEGLDALRRGRWKRLWKTPPGYSEGRKIGWRKYNALAGLGDCLVIDPSGKVVVQLRGRNVISAAPGYTVKQIPRGMAGLGRGSMMPGAEGATAEAPEGLFGEDLFGFGRTMMPGAEGSTQSEDLFGLGRGSMMPGAEGATSEHESADMFGIGEESDLF